MLSEEWNSNSPLLFFWAVLWKSGYAAWIKLLWNAFRSAQQASLQQLEMCAEHQSIWELKKLLKDVLLRGDRCACPFSSESCVWSSWWLQLPQMPPGACKYLCAPKSGLIGLGRSSMQSSAGCRCHPCLCLQEEPSPGFLHECWETGPVDTIFHLHTSAGTNSSM